MNVLLSLWTKPCLDGKSHGYRTKEELIQSLILSVNVAKKHYDNIIFYTDKIGMEWIKPHLQDLPFSKIEVCLDNLNWLDDKYWSLSKMYVYNLQKEPFIHIDNDVFLFDKLPDELTKNDFFFQEVEKFNEMGRDFYIEGLRVYKDALDESFIIPDAAFNCGIFGCATQKALELISEYYRIGYDFVKKTKKLKNLHVEAESSRWLATVIIEQVVIYSLVVNGDYSFDVLLHHNENYNGYKKKYNIRYTHTLAHHKRNPIIVDRINERVVAKNWF